MAAGALLQIALTFVVVFVTTLDPLIAIIAAVILTGLSEIFDLILEMAENARKKVKVGWTLAHLAVIFIVLFAASGNPVSMLFAGIIIFGIAHFINVAGELVDSGGN